ncbi:MAG: pilus assembly protein PilM [Lachnospiraceae bacterium]|jgi:type IV pilus assembly protein PilN|nr:pilus assembly protein PilM [Lachnospiraceae bacterium]
MANRVLCIEIGNRMTHVVETDFKVKEPKIYKSFSFQTPDNLFKEETLADVLPFKERLDAGLEEHKIKTRKAVFVLASSRIASRDVVIPHVKENRIRTLLYANSAEYFPVDLEKYQLSYRLLDEVEEEGEQKYKLMVLAVPNEMIDAYKSLAKVCLLTLVDLDYIGNAATQLLEKNIKNDLYAAVRLEEDTTMITIVRENKIELQRTFPYGIADVIQAVQKSGHFGEDIDFYETLEKMRKENVLSLEEEEIQEDITEGFRAITGNVSRVMNFYSSNHAGAEMENIVLYGTGADICGMEQYLSDELSIPVSGESLREALPQEKGNTGDYYPLMYLTCVGAAVNPMKFRLEDEKEVAEKKKEHKQIHIEPKNFFGICVVVSLVLLLAVVPYYGYLKMGVHKLQKERSEKQYLADEYKEYNQAKTEYEKIENLYQETTTTSEGIGDFIDELEKNMPSDILVRSITSNSESVTMDIRVSSKREAAKVVDELSDFESISDVQVESLEETKSETNQSYVDFMVVCTYVGGTADGDAQNETTMSEDVEALETKQQDQTAGE